MQNRSDTPGDGLNPCPFCGKSDACLSYDGGVVLVHCRFCGSEGSASESNSEAIAAWNHRSPSIGSDTAGPSDHAGLVSRPWRCDITGNPVGTDTRMIGAPPCDCQGCRAAEAIAALNRAPEAVIAEWRTTAEIEAGVPLAAPPAPQPPVNGDVVAVQIEHMVSRFLVWRLPDNFAPDCGISFQRTFNEHTDHPMKHEPTGTNLFDGQQATAMVRYMLEGLPQPDNRVVAALIEKAFSDPVEFRPTGWRENYPALRLPSADEAKARILSALSASPPQPALALIEELERALELAKGTLIMASISNPAVASPNTWKQIDTAIASAKRFRTGE